MKSKVFICSSSESLDIAYAIQENLEQYVEVTVWRQGIFQLSKYTLDSLVDALDGFDFGIFVLGPDDITNIRNTEYQTARDNVVFELGLFIGRLGKDRNFLIIPKGQEDFHLPTDLLGLTAAMFEPNRADNNLEASLGPACSKIRKAIQRLGALRKQPEVAPSDFPPVSANKEVVSEEYDENDFITLLEHWLGERSRWQNLEAIRYSIVEEDLNLPKGIAKEYIAIAARKYGYEVERKGAQTILFIKTPDEPKSDEIDLDGLPF